MCISHNKKESLKLNMDRCESKTLKGDQCKRKSSKLSNFCSHHEKKRKSISDENSEKKKKITKKYAHSINSSSEKIYCFCDNP